MKHIAIQIGLILLSTFCANAQSISTSIGVTSTPVSSSIQVQQPVYSGVLSGNHSSSDPFFLSGGFHTIEVIFYGHADAQHLYALYLDTNSYGSNAYVDFQGRYTFTIPGNTIIQLSFNDDESCNCIWAIY